VLRDRSGENRLFGGLAGQNLVETLDDFLRDLPNFEAWQPAAPLASTRLSVREAEVLRLVATGKSNQQIADELVISLNTVNRHVSNIYAKTGSANRAQAAVYARDHGLT